MTLRERAITILNALAKEHGSETFVSDGYGYYDDAADAIEQFAQDVRREALDECETIAKAEHRYQSGDSLDLSEFTANIREGGRAAALSIWNKIKALAAAGENERESAKAKAEGE
jgi:hypothetical protein